MKYIPFFPIVGLQGVELPRSAAEAKQFADARNREAKERRATRDLEHKQKMQEARGLHIVSGSRRERPAGQPAPAATRPTAAATGVSLASQTYAERNLPGA